MSTALLFEFGRAVGALVTLAFERADHEGDADYEARYGVLHAAVVRVFDQIAELPGNDLANLRLQATALLWADPDLAILAGQSLAARMNRTIVRGLLGLLTSG